jgi:DinB family protein
LNQALRHEDRLQLRGFPIVFDGEAAPLVEPDRIPRHERGERRATARLGKPLREQYERAAVAEPLDISTNSDPSEERGRSVDIDSDDANRLPAVDQQLRMVASRPVIGAVLVVHAELSACFEQDLTTDVVIGPPLAFTGGGDELVGVLQLHPNPGLSWDVTVQLDEAVPSWCLRLTSELHAADARARALTAKLTPEQLNWKPDPAAWSVGQCLEHLCVGNEIYVRAMSGSLTGRPMAVVQDITPGWFGRWFIRNYIEPSPQTKRARAPKKITPGSRVEPTVLDRFVRSNDAVRDLMHRARNCDVNRIRFPNPFVPVIRFTVGTGFEILSKHQSRHLLQAERVKASLDSVTTRAGEPSPA